MIFGLPQPDDPIDQGDLITECPVNSPVYWDLDAHPAVHFNEAIAQVVVITQTCDLANEKTQWVQIAIVLEAQSLVERGVLSRSQIRDQVRSGRVWGYYFLPKNEQLGIPESVVDLRQLHTLPLGLLKALCQRGKRKARLQPLYREHLNQHFANSYARIGLPEPYATDPA